MMGFIHAVFGPRGLRRAWSSWDEAAIWKRTLVRTLEGA